MVCAGHGHEHVRYLKMGIKRKYSDDERTKAVGAYNAGTLTAAQAAKQLGISKPRFYQILDEDGGAQTIRSQLAESRSLLTKLYLDMEPCAQRTEISDFLIR